jgi:hypothetical protein
VQVHPPVQQVLQGERRPTHLHLALASNLVADDDDEDDDNDDDNNKPDLQLGLWAPSSGV